ncbi:MAG: alpha/beta fold hydrolase [Rhodospirillaceae bacterium]|nr:alpha/beta fold hydrolase [Rhodospirillaceae bacterium]
MLATPYEEIIETSEGPAFVNVIGKGPPVFIVHGGPGFDHSYLLNSLSFLSAKRTLIFYDQPGCGKTPTQSGGATLSKTAKHFCAVVESMAPEGKYGLIAHSWGSMVAVSAFAEAMNVKLNPFTEGLLINPVPVTNEAYDKCAENLLSRIPAEIMKQAESIMGAGGAGESIMNLLLPFYGAHTDRLSGFSMSFRYDTYFGINGALGAFDFRDQLSAFAKLTLVRGSEDFTTPNLIGEMIEAVSKTHTMNGVGHFPFLEDKQEFKRLALDIFS